jgi:hypothetical protein
VYGETAVVWLQGALGATTLMVDQMYQPPGPFLTRTLRYTTTSQPVFSWTRPHGWGPMHYSLAIDGSVVGQTYGSSGPPAAPVPDGPHRWQVFAANPGGQQSKTKVAPVFIDTVAPRVRLKLRGAPVPGSKLRGNVSYVDRPPPGEPPSDASGVTSVIVRWGDGTSTRVRLGTHAADHAYRHPGRYRITVLVSDRAGNLTRLATKLKVVKSLPKHNGKTNPLTTTTTTTTTGGASKPKVTR